MSSCIWGEIPWKHTLIWWIDDINMVSLSLYDYIWVVWARNANYIHSYLQLKLIIQYQPVNTKMLRKRQSVSLPFVPRVTKVTRYNKIFHYEQFLNVNNSIERTLWISTERINFLWNRCLPSRCVSFEFRCLGMGMHLTICFCAFFEHAGVV